MKNKKILYLASVFIFIGYLFYANYIFNVLIKTPVEANPIALEIPEPTQNIKFNIEKIREEKVLWKNMVFIRGWLFKEDVEENERKVFLLLQSETDTLMFDVLKDEITRKDVSKTFKLVNAHKHGFQLFIPSYFLEQQNYAIGIVVEDKTGRYFLQSKKEIFQTPKGWSIRDIINFKPPQLLSSPSKLNLNKSKNKIQFNFDKIYKNEQFIEMQGWAFLQNAASDGLNSYVLLRKNGKVFDFKTTRVVRKDVTSHFKAQNLNLDSSGFSAKIPKMNLDKGKYQIGLFLKKDNIRNVIFVDNYIDI